MQFPATLVQLAEKLPPMTENGKKFKTGSHPFHAISSNFGSAGRKAPPPHSVTKVGKKFKTGFIHFMQFPATLVQLAEKLPPPPVTEDGKKFKTGSINFMQFPATLVQLAEKPPSFCLLLREPSSHHTCRIPMVPILQIHSQIPPIQISSLGYQIYQLFKLLTYTEVQDTGSWCRWKAYRQPYHNTH